MIDDFIEFGKESW